MEDQEERMMRFAEWLLDENKAHWCDLKKEHEYFLDNVENKK